MARDLIPPPSPAGRPVPDGVPRLDGPPRFIELPPEPVERHDEPPPSVQTPLAPSRFRNRFGFLIGALAGVVIALVAVLVIAVTQSNDPASGEGLAKNWSAWQPSTDDPSSGASQIAKFVGPKYRLADGAQIAQVTASSLPIGGTGLHVALRPAKGNITELNGHAIVYTLDGLGPMGSIKGGTPSTARHQLVRREALELSLYSFRYLKGVDTVVTLLPPALPQKTQTSQTTEEESPTSIATITTRDTTLEAIVFRPGDLKPELEVPLRYTVPAKTPNPTTMGGADGRRVDALTLNNLFQASFQHSQNLTPYLVLDRAETG